MDDRLGLLDGGISLFEQALLIRDPERRGEQLYKAVQTLNEVRGQLLKNAATEIQGAAALPQEGVSFWWRNLWSGALHIEAQRYLEQAGEEVSGALTATFHIVRAYQILGEEAASSAALNDIEKWWQVHSIDAAKAARLVKAFRGRRLPESLWELSYIERFRESLWTLERKSWDELEFQLEYRMEDLLHEPSRY